MAVVARETPVTAPPVQFFLERNHIYVEEQIVDENGASQLFALFEQT